MMYLCVGGPMDGYRHDYHGPRVVNLQVGVAERAPASLDSPGIAELRSYTYRLGMLRGERAEHWFLYWSQDTGDSVLDALLDRYPLPPGEWQ